MMQHMNPFVNFFLDIFVISLWLCNKLTIVVVVFSCILKMYVKSNIIRHVGSGGFSYSAVQGFSIQSGRDPISVHSAINVIILIVFNSLTYTNRWCWLLHELLFVAAQGQQGGGSWNNLGSNYSNTYAGGPQRGASNYQQRSTGPYGGKLNHLSIRITSCLDQNNCNT